MVVLRYMRYYDLHSHYLIVRHLGCLQLVSGKIHFTVNIFVHLKKQ